MKQRIYLILSLTAVLVGLFSCQDVFDSSLEPDKIDDNIFSIVEAQEIIQQRTHLASTKSDYLTEGKTNVFYSEKTLFWDDAIITSTDSQIAIDVPSNNNNYILKLQDGEGFYLSELHHSVTIIKTKDGKEASAYNHFFIPFRENYSTNSIINKKNNPYLSYTNFSERRGFSGLELWSTLEGNIIGARRYYKGQLFDNLYVKENKEHAKKIKFLLDLYVKGYYCRHTHNTKSANTTFLCPQCGEVLSQIEIGYVCWSCGWTEYDELDGGELDPSIIIGERDDSINNGDVIRPGGGGNGDDNYPTPGGNGGGFRGPEEERRDSLLNKYHYDDDAENEIKPTMEMLLGDCLGNTIINNVGDMNISFVKEYNTTWMAAFRPQTNRISYFLLDPPISPIVLIEELFHAMQKKNGMYNSIGLNNINVEIEAKMLAYLYACKNGLKDLLPLGYLNWDNSFGVYVANPSEENYQIMVSFVRSLGYASAQDYVGYHNMVNLSSFSNCLEYVADYNIF